MKKIDTNSLSEAVQQQMRKASDAVAEAVRRFNEARDDINKRLDKLEADRGGR